MGRRIQASQSGMGAATGAALGVLLASLFSVDVAGGYGSVRSSACSSARTWTRCGWRDPSRGDRLDG